MRNIILLQQPFLSHPDCARRFTQLGVGWSEKVYAISYWSDLHGARRRKRTASSMDSNPNVTESGAPRSIHLQRISFSRHQSNKRSPQSSGDSSSGSGIVTVSATTNGGEEDSKLIRYLDSRMRSNARVGSGPQRVWLPRRQSPVARTPTGCGLQ